MRGIVPRHQGEELSRFDCAVAVSVHLADQFLDLLLSGDAVHFADECGNFLSGVPRTWRVSFPSLSLSNSLKDSRISLLCSSLN